MLERARQRIRKGQGGQVFVDHSIELVAGNHPIPVSISHLEALPVEPVHLLEGVGSGVLGVLAHVHELILLHLVDGRGEASHVLLIVDHGKGEPLVEGDGPVVVVINLGKEFLWLLAPPAETKLVGNQISGLDHGGELFHGNLAIVINIGFGEGSEEDVVELNVRVALCALDSSLHEHDEFILVFDIHGAKGD